MFEKASLLALIALAAGGGESYPATCAKPLDGWETNSSGFVITQPINRAHMRPDGTILWNGNPINDAQLAEYSALVASMAPQSFTILAIDPGVDCERVKVVRKIIDNGAKCRSGGLCGESGGQWTTTYNPRQR